MKISIIASTLLLTGCFASQVVEPAITPVEPIAEESVAETEPAEDFSGAVSAADYGDEWPFTVEEGQINCLPGRAIVFTTEEASYPLNGNAMSIAETFDLKPLEEIWKDSPLGGGTKISVGPFIDLGLSRCRGSN